MSVIIRDVGRVVIEHIGVVLSWWSSVDLSKLLAKLLDRYSYEFY